MTTTQALIMTLSNGEVVCIDPRCAGIANHNHLEGDAPQLLPRFNPAVNPVRPPAPMTSARLAELRECWRGVPGARELLTEVDRLRDQRGAVLQLCDETEYQVCDDWDADQWSDAVRSADVRQLLA